MPQEIVVELLKQIVELLAVELVLQLVHRNSSLWLFQMEQMTDVISDVWGRLP